MIGAVPATAPPGWAASLSVAVIVLAACGGATNTHGSSGPEPEPVASEREQPDGRTVHADSEPDLGEPMDLSVALREAFADRARAESLLDLTFEELGLADDVPFANSATGDEPESPTCRDYPRLRREGHELNVPATDSGISAYLHRVCIGLNLAALGRTPSRTAIDEFDVVRNGLEQLPLDLVRRVFENTTAPQPGTLAAEYDASMVQPSPGSRELIICPPTELEMDRACKFFEELGRGDFDHDGQEDLVLMATSQSGGPSMQLFFGVFVLTRDRPNQPFRFLDIDLVEGS
jgi:hypothetical protein